MSYPDPYHPQQQPPHYPPPTVAPQPGAKRNNGNSRGWQILEALMFFASDSSEHSLGDTARNRVKTGLMIYGIMFVGVAILVLVLVLMH